MTIVYDMVAGQFLEEEPTHKEDQQAPDIQCKAVSLQLQLVENSSDLNQKALPADLAYQTFLLTE